MFSVAIDLRCGEATIRLAGELDVATLPCLEAVVEGLVDAGATSLVFDCNGLTFVDWIALRRVASLTRDATAAGVGLTVRNLSLFTLGVLEVTGLTGLELRAV
ncbi:MAG: STAS domain-containing protein [Actinomycetota bacterium]|nr:STAS domain-containing protein [Actinomycetota bacterium]